MSLTDSLTGGKNQAAQESLRKAREDIAGVQAPTAEQLTLPQLQEYVNAGIMTPAEMQAYIQEHNAYETENTDQTGTAAQIAALNQLSGVADSGAAGTPVEQAQQGKTIQDMNTAVGGQRGAIEQAAEARGTPAALVQAALENQTVGQDAQQAHQDALQSQAQAYQEAVNAMSGKATVGSNLQTQRNTQANTVAAATNAMQQFNAAQKQSAAAADAARKQEANAYDTENAQNISAKNTGNANTRTEHNANVPQTVFEDQLRKATGEAGVAKNQADQSTAAGQQEAGLWGGIIGAGATLAGGPAAGMAAKTAFDTTQPNKAPAGTYPGMAHGGIVDPHEFCYHEGGICMEDGGMVPGHAEIQGDSLKNDKVPAMVSPGEAVIPRTVVQQHMPEVLSLIASGHGQPPHPHDIATLLAAMKHLRGAA